MDKELLAYLSTFVTEERKKRFEDVLAWRTRHIAIALEDIYQSHNASAVLRSCDCFGIQDVHIIENRNSFTANSEIDLGSSKWLSLHKYNKRSENNTAECISTLKKKGYRIIATTPHENGIAIDDLDINTKLCLVFGTELEGVTSDVHELADGFARIPMFGFTESFNISVSAALCLNVLIKKLHGSAVNWHLSDDDKDSLRLQWMRSTISKSELIEKDFFEKKK